MQKIKTDTHFVNSNIYAASAEGEVFSQDSVYPQIPDPIRYYSSNFWMSERNQLIKSNIPPLFTVEDTSDNEIYSLVADKSKFVNKNNFVNGILTRTFDKLNWQVFVEDMLKTVSNQEFVDHNTHLQTPVVIPELTSQFTDSVAYLNREFIYNFHARRFENLATDISFSPTILPTVYDITRDINLDTRTEEENLTIRFGGIIEGSLADSLVMSKESNESLLAYFDEYAKAYERPDTRSVVLRLAGKNKTNIIGTDDLARTAKYKKDFVPFPYYNKVEFSNKNHFQGSITEILSQNGDLQNNLLDFIDNYSLPNTVNFIKFNEGISEEALTVHSLKNWISRELETDFSPDKQTKITHLLNSIKKNLPKYTRKLNKLMDESASVSAVWYKIEKRLFNHTSTPVQTYFIDANGPALIDFIDNQIKYGTEYYYTITCIAIVTGMKYSYSSYYNAENAEKLSDIASGIYKIKIKSAVDYAVIEMPYAKFSGAAHEKPNCSPQISFELAKDQVSIVLKQPASTEYSDYRAIENGEVALYESIRLSQENDDPQKIKYSGVSGDLQIYRITDKPNSYLSFQNKLYKLLALKEYQKTLYDELQINKKYYYLFRYLNAHGVPSNASQIYEVVLRDEEGYRYIETSVIDLDPELVRKPTKDFKRYMLIKASQLQSIPHTEDQVSSIDDIQLGPSDGQMWNRGFLLKIKSKKTNRELFYRFKLNLNKKN